VFPIQLTRQLRVSKEINEACLFETKVWRNKTALFVQQIIPINFDKIHESLKCEENPVNLTVVTLDSSGSRYNLFSVIRGQLNNVI